MDGMSAAVQAAAQRAALALPSGVWEAAAELAEPLRPAVSAVTNSIGILLHLVDTALAGVEPWKIVGVTVLLTIATVAVLRCFTNWAAGVRAAGGPVKYAFSLARPLTLRLMRGRMAEIKAKLLAARPMPAHPVTALPAEGLSAESLLQELQLRKSGDKQIEHGLSKVSGTVYIPGAAHHQLMDQVFESFSITNPLHTDQFPSVVRMEAEVIAMTASMLGGGPGTDVCGSMTSGGSESILMAMKASRDWMKARRGITAPELIIAASAHAAYFKAAEYFNMRLVVLPVGPDLRLSGEAVRRAMTRNTAVVVASAPCYPHGVVDHVADIAVVCKRAGVCLHVDACLGGFVLPFIARLGRDVPPFDFRVPGVTSMSVDTHKFGLAHKGSSVVLYANPGLRARQYTAITDWTGGLYISPSLAGSRPGGLIATAWAALMVQGVQGYTELARQLLALSDGLQAGIKEQVPELCVLGHPDMCLVAFAAHPSLARKLNVYKVKDWMGRRGWYLSALQQPPALHFCFTPAHVGHGTGNVVALMLTDLRAAVDAVLHGDAAKKAGSIGPPVLNGGAPGENAANGTAAHSSAAVSKRQDDAEDDDGVAPLYGMANVIPDRRLVGEFLELYQDVQLTA